jgi:transcriptional regulator with XRE-family HTH domain
MNGNDAFDPQTAGDDIVELGSSSPRIILHRLKAVRRAMGMQRREFAQRLGMTIEELRQKEVSTDLSISTLYRWAAQLGVPITEFIVEPEECLAPTRLAPSQATRLMKAAAKLRDRSRRRSIQRLAQTFVEQLTEILPTLEALAQKNHGSARRPHRQPPPSGPRALPGHVFTRNEPPNR